jgi:hypothetical protein
MPEDLEQKLRSWTGLKNHQSSQPLLGNDKEATKKKTPASILKTPKYSAVTAVAKHNTIASSSQQTLLPPLERSNIPPATRPKPVVCEQLVVERDPFVRKKKQQQPKVKRPSHHSAIEGYQPADQKEEANESQEQISEKTDTISEKSPDDDTSPIILSSLEQLIKAAGEKLPQDPSTITPDSQLVEADLAFSVMTQDQYGKKMTEMKREMEDEQRDHFKIFMGNEHIFEGESNDDSSDSEGEESFLNFLMEQEMSDGEQNYNDDDDEQQEVAAPRSFALIWSAFSEWLTHEAVEWMARLESPDVDRSNKPLFHNNWTPQVDRSDIGASRCAGLMAMIKMYLPTSMRELKHPEAMRRTAESRIADFLRTFDYSSEAPKLPVKMWKAVTCILLDMVLLETRVKTVMNIPPAVQAVGMSVDEYKYLTRSAIQAFQP